MNPGSGSRKGDASCSGRHALAEALPARVVPTAHPQLPPALGRCAHLNGISADACNDVKEYALRRETKDQLNRRANDDRLERRLTGRALEGIASRLQIAGVDWNGLDR